jgi:AcrR family transcriptional regulator
VRRALIELVAENGFRGTSMAAVAERAGVATGTAYVHYESKDDLVFAAYKDVKEALGAAAATGIAADETPRSVFLAMWHAMYSHLANDPVQARFLVQVEASPYAAAAHEAAMSAGAMADDPQMARLKSSLVPLPALTLWDLGMGPAVRVVASGSLLPKQQRDELAAACWRAVSQP